MHYQSDITSIDDTLWTREELEFWLRKRFKSSDLVLPDEKFYGNANTKSDLIKLADRIKKQLRLRKNITFTFSEKIKAPGITTLQNSKLSISLPISLYGNPLRAASCISHQLAHALLLTEKRQQLDQIENERIADYACLQAGLGIVILNGANKGGWRTLIAKRSIKFSPVLGFFSVPHFGIILGDYIKERGIDHKQIDRHIVPWLRNHVMSHRKDKRQKITKALMKAKVAHKKSIVWLFTSLVIILFIVAAAGFISLKNTYFIDSKLASLKQQSASLEAAYNSCVNQYEELKQVLPTDQISSERYLSLQQTRCKSLQNQYNAASKAHNEYLRSK